MDPLYKFKEKSTWRPKETPLEVQQLTRTFKQFLINKIDKNPSSKNNNINESQQKLIKTIKNNHEITIKKADKGAAVVILYTSDYLR